jgi:hypothetical protein
LILQQDTEIVERRRHATKISDLLAGRKRLLVHALGGWKIALIAEHRGQAVQRRCGSGAEVMKVRIAPSLLSADFARLAEALAVAEAGGADLVHVDVMDGHFVPNLTIGPPVVRALRKATKLPLDVHLMIEDPERTLPAYLDAGADLFPAVEDPPDAIRIRRCPRKIPTRCVRVDCARPFPLRFEQAAFDVQPFFVSGRSTSRTPSVRPGRRARTSAPSRRTRVPSGPSRSRLSCLGFLKKIARRYRIQQPEPRHALRVEFRGFRVCGNAAARCAWLRRCFRATPVAPEADGRRP